MSTNVPENCLNAHQHCIFHTTATFSGVRLCLLFKVLCKGDWYFRLNIFSLIYRKISDPDSSEQPHQEDGGEDGKKKGEDERTENVTVKDEEVDGESSDWPKQRVCHTHERAIPIQETVEALDITEEGA